MRVLYLDIDSMRPDHFGCYGYRRPTTPNLDRVAREGARFSRAYCNSSPCVPARASFVSGRFGVHHGALTHWGPGSEFRFPSDGIDYSPEMPLVPRYLREHGYRTVSFSSFADRHQANWFYAGWTEMRTHTLKMGREVADEVNAAVLPWLRANGRTDDWFLHVQYWDPHRDYTVGREWIDLFADHAPPAWPDAAAIERHQAGAGPFMASELHPFGSGRARVPTMPDRIASVEDWTRFVDGYDGAIRYLDDRIGQLLATLDELGVLGETAVVVSADHGEALGEQGVYGDHVSAGDAVHNVPMIVRWPGAGAEDVEHDGLVYNVDVHPTLCDLLGIPSPEGWDGRSFAAAVRGEAWEGRPYLVWDHGLYSCQRVVRTPGWLYARTYHPGLYDFAPKELYDVRADPRQTTDLAADRPQVTAELDGLMQDWLQGQVGHPGSEPDPMPEIVRTGPWKYVGLEEWVGRLRGKGRDADAAAILGRLGLD